MLPVSVLIIIGLFIIQWRGTGIVGGVFGPVMAVWFAVIGVLGALEIARQPSVLAAVSPTYAFGLVVHDRWLAFVALGSVVLAVTGAEALYADMGHFGAPAIRTAWTWFVLPSLVQLFRPGRARAAPRRRRRQSLLPAGPGLAAPAHGFLATAATVIASQAVITGAYSMARQCVQLGFLPRLVVHHTSATEEGQIYAPQINFALMIGVLILVFSFRSSDNLASAYGIAVTGTFICTCLLAAVVFRRQFHWSRIAVVAVFGFFIVIDGIFFAANMLKFPEGGWMPLVLGLALMGLMTSWKRGRDLLLNRWRQDSLPLESFLARLPQSRIVRVPGMAIFLTGNPLYVPGALLHNLKHNKVLHESVLFVTVQNLDVPEVPPEERVSVTELAAKIHRVIIRYGFMQSPNLPRDLAALQSEGVEFDPMQASFFLGRETLVASARPKLPLWRLWLFLFLARNAVSATEFFRIPSDRVVELGARVSI